MKFIINLDSKKLIITISILIILLTLFTKYYGSTDIGDYADVAKFFAGNYAAKIRSSHSYLFGFVHTPIISLTNSFIGFKITSLIFLFIIIYSVYLMSNRDKKTLWLMLLSPAVWYMAPWINPIQLTSFLLLWAFYFINQYDKSSKISYLLYSGLLVGLGWAFWNTILFFGSILGIVYLWNKKLYHSFYFIIFVFIGLIPVLILDQIIFNFAFYTTIKTFVSNILATFLGGIYESNQTYDSNMLIRILIILVTIPIHFWIFYLKLYKENNKSVIFLSLSILLILTNPQLRYTLAMIPIIILLIGRKINSKQFKIQIIISIILSLIVIIPYLMQINSNHGKDIIWMIDNKNINIFEKLEFELISNDLNQIEKDFPIEVFIVSDTDDYAVLARNYWGDNIKEFVSIQDYELFLQNKSIIFKKRFMPVPNIKDRRQIWIEGGINKNENDDTNYEAIKYGISVDDDLGLDNFKLIKKYNVLHVWEKIN